MIGIMNKVILISLAILSCLMSIGQIAIENTSIGIEPLADICFESDLYVAESVDWFNQGTVSLNSIKPTIVIFDTKETEYSKGKIVFTGNESFLFSSSGSAIQIQNLDINNDVKIDNNLYIGNTLRLKKGILSLEDIFEIKILNGASSSLTTESTNTYINGKLSRAVIKDGGIYLFPIGNNNISTNIFIRDNSDDGEVKIWYNDSDISAYNLLTKNSELVPFCWSIYTSSSNLRDNLSFQMDVDITNVYKSDDDDFQFMELICKNHDSNLWGLAAISNFATKLSSIKNLYQGDYAMIKMKGLDFVNAIIVNGINSSMFIIPKVDWLDSGELIIIDSKGRIVFQSNKYSDDFDVSTVKAGTYYYRYIFKNNITNKQYEKKGFLEVIYEK